MLRLSNLKAPPGTNADALKNLCAKRLNIDVKAITELKIIKKSVDARDKSHILFVYTVDISVPHEIQLLSRMKRNTVQLAPPASSIPSFTHRFIHRPIVVGAGPAGLFAAYFLAQNGANPILIERGCDVDKRTSDVDLLFSTGQLHSNSNVQFGEGGAGAFSDGKLTTGTKSPYQQFVLDTFYRHGAPEEILYLGKPHIGTDKLKPIVKNIRQEMIAMGGSVYFETQLIAVQSQANALHSIVCHKNDKEILIPCDTLILAIGHSARDTYQHLFNQGVNMAQKPFAIGVRIEHLQRDINMAQYGTFTPHKSLGAADYKLNAHTKDGRGVYTFCMCPGGTVVAAASQEGGVVTNGMSDFARNQTNANAAILVGVRPSDFGDDHPLSGLVLQRSLEQSAYILGGGAFKAPCQRVEDFLKKQKSTSWGEVIPSYLPGVTFASLDDCLPPFIAENLRYGIVDMNQRLHGFAHPDAVLTGVETRSSSPVRILRDHTGQTNISGIFPAGEGAGYAGGIMSAATDGIKMSIQAMERSLL